MQLFITPVTGQSICVDIKNNCQYKELKELISKKFNLPFNYFKIIYNGKYIEHSFKDDNTLEEIGIVDNATLRIR